MNELIKEKLKLLPTNPGCYLMKDLSGTIIYVGKAKNLKNRVSSYFTGAHNAKTTLLVSEIVDFEYIITESELESFVLEINLIKNHLPKYNIKLVDDATYPYILITNEKHPRLLVVREELSKKKGKFFGPYPNVSSARKTQELLNKLYPFRKCHKIPNKECLYYHMHQCLAPCINHLDIDYSRYINEVSDFLKGNTKGVTSELEAKMMDASLNLEFEKALEYRDLLNDIKSTTEKQKIANNDLMAHDVIGIYSSLDEVSIEILYLRLGAIVQNYRTIIPIVGDLEETILPFLAQYYSNENILPKEIYINGVINPELLSKALNIPVNIPLKGQKKKVMEMAIKNAQNNYENHRMMYQNKVVKKQDNIYRLAELLNINPPIIIEAFDNSNLYGDYPVSAMVSFKNGIKSPKDYRKYHVKTVVGANDYETMKEVVYRRYFRLLIEEQVMPNLIIMDGGEIQVNAALETLASLNLEIPVMGLKKDDTHTTNVIVYNGKEIHLSRNDDLYLFLANIQQTVHDFAISFFRNSKAKGMFMSRLDGISGLGPKKKEKLLKSYLTIDKIKNLSIEEFKSCGINEDLAIKILEKLNGDKND